MVKKDKRIDDYITKSADFAKPILKHIRKIVHETCPDTEEKIKWGMPHFDYKEEMMCAMAAFKQHCVFGFWKGSLLSDPNKLISEQGNTAMGSFGQIKSLSDLPSDKILIKYIKEAMKLNDEGVKVARPKPTEKKELKVPDYFKRALKNNKKAFDVFEKFSYSDKKEYVEWITEAKTEATREKRLETAIEWISEGKSRLWKYKK
jgi:uncharacterized protein YdeI (YjbR/CyaY-like superfamily)